MCTPMLHCLDCLVLQGAEGMMKDQVRSVEHGMGGTNDRMKCHPMQGMNIRNYSHRTDTGTDLQPQQIIGDPGLLG